MKFLLKSWPGGFFPRFPADGRRRKALACSSSSLQLGYLLLVLVETSRSRGTIDGFMGLLLIVINGILLLDLACWLPARRLSREVFELPSAGEARAAAEAALETGDLDSRPDRKASR